MHEIMDQVRGCVVRECHQQASVPLCSGETHLCSCCFDSWVAFLRKHPLDVEKWSTDNFASWQKHFQRFLRQQRKLMRDVELMH